MTTDIIGNLQESCVIETPAESIGFGSVSNNLPSLSGPLMRVTQQAWPNRFRKH
jgi:hypothetical protein